MKQEIKKINSSITFFHEGRNASIEFENMDFRSLNKEQAKVLAKALSDYAESEENFRKWSIAFVPKNQKQYIEASEGIASKDAVYRLNHKSSIPHCTFLHLDCKKDLAKEIFEATKKEIEKQTSGQYNAENCRLAVEGMSIKYGELGHWIELSVDRSYWLGKVSEKMKQFAFERRPFGEFVNIINGTGEFYYPHITLARIKSGGELKIDIANTLLLQRREEAFKLVFCRRDEQFQLEIED
jgi:hypothetical protein